MPRKDHARDYATAAFSLYAKEGRPDEEKILKEILDTYNADKSEDKVQRGLPNPTQAAILLAEKRFEERRGKYNDLMAAHRTMDLLVRAGGGRLQAVRMVYLSSPDTIFERGEISARVVKASLEIPASERQVYRWLKEAREWFCIERGLRSQENNFSKDVSSTT